MSDETMLSPDALNTLLAQAEAKARMKADEDRLTPAEADIRRRFALALWGPPGEEYLSEIRFSDPTTLVVMAEAYREEAHRVSVESGGRSKGLIDRLRLASMFLLGIWMAVRHQSFRDYIESNRLSFPGYLPPLPKDWKRHRASVYEAMALDLPADPTVVPFTRR